MVEIKDYTGERFGKLVVIKEGERVGPFDKSHKNGHRSVVCKCDCGNIKQVRLGTIVKRRKHGKSISCGCLLKEYYNKQDRKHGFCNSDMAFYKRYIGIQGRCNNKRNTGYKNYGGRGVIVEWGSFEEFKDDMYESYLVHSKKYGGRNTQIERLDVNGNYCKENCIWVTHKQQQNNRRGNVFITYKGETKTLSQRAEKTGINSKTLDSRRRMGWDDEKIIGTPILRASKL